MIVPPVAGVKIIIAHGRPRQAADLKAADGMGHQAVPNSG